MTGDVRPLLPALRHQLSRVYMCVAHVHPYSKSPPLRVVLVQVRRDNCALVRQVVDTVLRMILVERSKEGAIEYVKGVISDLLQNKIDLSMLVITKALGKGADSDDYKAKQVGVDCCSHRLLGKVSR